MFHKSHKDILELAERFTNEELFSKDVYKWVGGSVLGSYFVSTTSSHYDWAMKKLKAHQKNCKKKISRYGIFLVAKQTKYLVFCK